MIGDDEEEFTEEIVEGIYSESQYKIENIPGYADAFKRVYECFRAVTLTDKPPNKQDEEKLQQAMSKLMLIELEFRYRINQHGRTDG